MTRSLKWGCIAPVVGLIALVGLVAALDAFLPSAARRALPASAIDIHEYYSEVGINGDFTRLIRANMSETEFHSYALSLGFTHRFDPVADSDVKDVIEMGISYAPSWWEPPEASSSTYFTHKRGDEYMKSLRYDHGTAYLLMTAW